MKRRILCAFLLLNTVALSQYEVSGGMGLNFFSAPDIKDYVNANFASVDEMPSFNTSADFFVELGYNINDRYQIALNYNYNIFSFNTNSIIGTYDLQINNHEPSVIGYYQYTGEGYKFKLGLGIGYRTGYADEKQPGTTEKLNYNSSGFGTLLKAHGNTRLGGDFYALIAGEMRYDIYGDIETITEGVNFNLNSFGIALKLGVVYYF